MRTFVVVATDPLRDWRCAQVTVAAISPDEAKRAARAELARDKRDEWSITLVIESSEGSMNRYIATRISRWSRDETAEVFGDSKDEAVAEAKKRFPHAVYGQDLFISGPVHFSADCYGGTGGD